MTLEQLIERLERADQNHICPIGFKHPHSYRGHFRELAFEPAANVSVGEMLKATKSALGSTYEGWKGGQFKMLEHTYVNLAYIGRTGEEIGPVLIEYMLNDLEGLLR